MISVALAAKNLGHLPYVYLYHGDHQRTFLVREKGLEIIHGGSLGVLDGPYSFDSNKIESQNRLDFSRFDWVISDTLTEISKLHSRTLLFAQFTWSHFFSIMSPSKSSFFLNDEVFDNLLAFQKIFGMHEFSWPSLAQLENYVGIPLLDYWNLRSRRKELERNDSIVIVKSGVDEKKWKNIIEDLKYEFEIVEQIENIREVPRGIICRAGMGAISEALALGSSPITIVDDLANTEIVNNQRVLLGKNWGLGLQEYVQQNGKIDKKSLFDALNLVETPSEEEFISPEELIIKYFN
jgi:hypothetical protein